MTLPTNIDVTYGDDAGDASVKLHQQHHDAIHTFVNGAVPSAGAAHNSTTSAAVAHGVLASLAFGTVHSGPTGLLDMTDPTAPTFVADGIYAVSCQVGPAFGVTGSAGSRFGVIITIGTEWTEQSNWPLDANGSELGQYAAMTAVWYADAGDAVSIQAIHDDTAGTHTFDLYAFVQRIA